MNLRHVVCVLAVVAISAGNTAAQADYLRRGEGGFELHTGYSTNEDASGFSLGVAYTPEGIVEATVSFARAYFDEPFFENDLKATAVSAGVAFNILKQDSPSAPFAASLGLGYERDWYSSRGLDLYYADMTANWWNFGFSVNRKIEASPKAAIMPRVMAGYIVGSTRIENSRGNYQDEDDQFSIIGLGLSLFLETGPTSVFRIDPMITYAEDITTFTVGLGVILRTE